MARTRGKDSLGSAHKPGLRRKIVHVFTEGKVTEPEYIDVVRKRAGATGVEVRIANASASGAQRKPIKLVEAAARLMREETRNARRGGLEKKFWPAVWCLFDRDQHDSIEAAMKQADDAGVRIAFSHPCFEVWRLLHHKPVTGTFGGVCDMAAARLPFADSGTNLKKVSSDQLPEGSYTQAKKYALKMNASHDERVPKVLRDPYTDVFEFVEEGLGISFY
ncbi:RloB family protein [Streptomyces phytohabitans]|uniref:RloB family protein n=1 Tax=Streptomyces phytohabitans TaxID=1150371 RepID=UPI00345C2E36